MITLQRQLIKFFRNNPERTFSRRDLYSLFYLSGQGTVNNALTDLRNRGLIYSPSHTKWKLK